LPLCLLASAIFLPGCSGRDQPTVLRVNPQSLAIDLPRYGLNLGGTGTWGAEQLRANVLANPGFEPILDRTIVVVGDVRSDRFSDDTDWLARPPGFWSGATFDVRSGAAAGQRGRIRDSRQSQAGSPDEFLPDSPVAGLRTGDVVTLSRDEDPAVAPHWWRGRGNVVMSRDTPPATAGRQSLRLLARPGHPAEIVHYLDTIGDRAGKLLPVNGAWKLSFWARRVGAPARLKVRFDRERTPAFLDIQVAPELTWKRYEFSFDARDAGPAGPLTLGFTAIDSDVLIDDAYLGEAEPGPGGFRRAVVETLLALKPGYLRDWQGQLGDTMDNRLSDELAHRPARYRPGAGESQFHYSLPDFLALCAAIGAQPWVIAPTTLADDEWLRLGEYLRSAADKFGFREIIIEFGNENWNTIFRPGGIPDPAALGKTADRGFRLLREGARHDPRFRTLINAQFVNPEGPRQLAMNSPEADRIGVAPYFMYRLDAGTPAHKAIGLAFADDPSLIAKEAAMMKALGKRLSVYEVNFHTTLGSASSAERDFLTTGAASGPALGRRLMQATLSGVREQAVYSFAGLDSYVDGSKALVRLWGITRDLATAGRLRPTGLALAQLNRVGGGSVHAIDCSGPACTTLTALAYAGGDNVAIVSASPEPAPIEMARSCANGATFRVHLLSGADPLRNNEALAQVGIEESRVRCRENRLSITIPPFSLLTLEPEAGEP